MTIRDMLNAGIEIEGNIRVVCWESDDRPTILFSNYAKNFGNQPFLDMEIKYIFEAGDHRITFEVVVGED